MPKVRLVLSLLMYSVAIVSCSNPKELQYLQGNLDSNDLKKMNVPELVIQKGDLLGITVFSDNAAASRPFNQDEIGNAAVDLGDPISRTTSGRRAIGPEYLVDDKGNISFPVIGIVKVEGLSKSELIELLNSKLNKYLSNPYYSIRFLNYKITLIGEVVKPGVYTVPTEKVNVLEAIGLAGDLTFFGKRENVLVIRENDGKREFGRLNLTDPAIFKSPYYHLKQNDIILVDMSKRKISANDQVAFRNISLVATVVSAVAVLVSVLNK